jgi:hypothetical protein
MFWLVRNGSFRRFYQEGKEIMTREQANLVQLHSRNCHKLPWVAGVNMPGYMPDVEPGAFETFAEARDHLLELLEIDYLYLAEVEDCEPTDNEIAEISLATDIVAGLKEDEFSAIIGRYCYWIMRNN